MRQEQHPAGAQQRWPVHADPIQQRSPVGTGMPGRGAAPAGTAAGCGRIRRVGDGETSTAVIWPAPRRAPPHRAGPHRAGPRRGPVSRCRSPVQYHELVGPVSE
ncbi:MULTISPECIES: hypothetical protein [Streptomyces]|uniref:hypothetical protein n=1 Tax=Streptomyces lycopersici TaxID=2974589 RepID=UPI0021D31597|nr:hypothetical protein [Streptomyces sp. NEAU-383]